MAVKIRLSYFCNLFIYIHIGMNQYQINKTTNIQNKAGAGIMSVCLSIPESAMIMKEIILFRVAIEINRL
jgi:hypothetical protein